jgi:hypothetical protein
MGFPRDAEKLRGIIEELQLDFLYFDAIYDHFQATEGLHAGERTRQALSSLAKVAGDTGCTIMGTFHTNKSGEFMGSTEMENVSRVLLKATRNDQPGSPLNVWVKKSNFKHPDFALAFALDESTIADPATGEVQKEEDKDGNMVPAKLSFARRIADVQLNTLPLDSISETSSVEVGEAIIEILGVAPEGQIKASELREAVMELVEVGLRTYQRALDKLVSTGVIERLGHANKTEYKVVASQGMSRETVA